MVYTLPAATKRRQLLTGSVNYAAIGRKVRSLSRALPRNRVERKRGEELAIRIPMREIVDKGLCFLGTH